MVIKVKNTKQKKKENKKKNIKSSVSKQTSTTNLAAVFDKHVNCEFEDKDVDATIKTMTKDPYVYHVPVLTGGTGYNEVHTFYSNNFVGKMPSDTKFVRISRTIPIIGIEQSKKLQELLSLSTQKKTQKKKAMETFAKAKT